MRAHQFAEMLRDADVANAIWPIIVLHKLSLESATEALTACRVPRADHVARIAFAQLEKNHA
jgi:hypothetical protein